MSCGHHVGGVMLVTSLFGAVHPGGRWPCLRRPDCRRSHAAPVFASRPRSRGRPTTSRSCSASSDPMSLFDGCFTGVAVAVGVAVGGGSRHCGTAWKDVGPPPMSPWLLGADRVTSLSRAVGGRRLWLAFDSSVVGVGLGGIDLVVSAFSPRRIRPGSTPDAPIKNAYRANVTALRSAYWLLLLSGFFEPCIYMLSIGHRCRQADRPDPIGGGET